MKIMVGWSGEGSDGNWRKIDVTLDETDLGRLAVEVGLSMEALATVPVAGIFALLEVEAQRLLLAELMLRFPTRFNTADSLNQLRGYLTARVKTVEKIRG